DKTKAIDAADTAAAAAAKAAAQPATAAAAPQPIDRAWALGGCLIAAWLLATAIVILANPKALAETHIALREGVLWPLFITALVMAGLALFGLFIVRKPTELLDSLGRWPAVSAQPEVDFPNELPAPPSAFDEPPEVTLNVNFRKDEIRALAILSDQHIKVRSEPFDVNVDRSLMVTLDIPAGETKTWKRDESSANPFREAAVTKLYA